MGLITQCWLKRLQQEWSQTGVDRKSEDKGEKLALPRDRNICSNMLLALYKPQKRVL